jgi:hypothetical protein
MKHTKSTYIIFQMEEDDKENGREVASISAQQEHKVILDCSSYLSLLYCNLVFPYEKSCLFYTFSPQKNRSKRRFFTKFLFMN